MSHYVPDIDLADDFNYLKGLDWGNSFDENMEFFFKHKFHGGPLDVFRHTQKSNGIDNCGRSSIYTKWLWF